MNPHIERLAREAGLPVIASGEYFLAGNAKIEAFARAVAEDCASIIPVGNRTAQEAIRARYGIPK